MVSEVSARIKAAPPPVPSMAGSAASSAPSADAVAQPKVQPIPKPEIKVNTEEMKHNLQEAISRLNEMMRDGGRGLNFSVDEKLGRPIVLVKNDQTGEVIRQIPNEVVVRVAHSIEDLKGILHNNTV